MASKKKLGYENNFEMLMIRHEYISKVKNPDPKWIKQWESIVNTTAMLMYNKLRPNFSKVGYELDDVKAITNCYMIGYMGLYSIERNKKSRDKILQSFKKRLNREPTDQEITRKERTNLISFLRQRLQHASLICSRKARNITVGRDRRAAYAFTKDSVPASDEMILEKGAKLGYRKITKKELKDIKLKARVENSKELRDVDGFLIIQLEFLNDGISEYDYRGIFINDLDNPYHKSPEESLILAEKDRNIEKFHKLDGKNKQTILKTFIKEHKDDKDYKDEVLEAKKMIKKLVVVV
jgi:hypothetical protein